MKNIFRLSILLLLIVMSSCRDEAGVSDFDEKRNNIIGEWTLTQTTNGNTNSDFTYNISFDADGTGERASNIFIPSPSTIQFEWVYQFNPEQIVIKETSGTIITELGQFMSLPNTFIFDVLQNSVDAQEWTTDDGFAINPGEVVTMNWSMER